MKKVILGLTIIGVLTLILVFFLMQRKKNAPAISSNARNFISELKVHQEAEPRTIISHKTEASPSQPAEVLFKEFNLPQGLQREITEAQRNGEIKDEWGEGKINIDELQKAGLTTSQFSQPELDKKIKNFTAGYSVFDKDFAQKLKDCLPDKNIDEQIKALNSEVVSAMGFSALMENNYVQAQQAFTALTRDYVDTQPAPIAYLELARLLFQQGRFKEAQELINKASSLYNDDKVYMVVAQSLQKEMAANE